MKGNKQVIDALNSLLTIELTSINRYFLHARMFKNWGIEALNEHCYKKSIKDMKQADELIERILFLEGLPNLQQLSPLLIGEDTEEILNCDLNFQLKQVTDMKAMIELCEKEQDFVTREILVNILDYEEDYVDWLETQQYQIENIGLARYIQTQIEEA